MSFFQMKVGNMFTIVATNGAANGHQPVLKSDATGYDVFDRSSCKMVFRDQPFDAAFDFCTRRLSFVSAKPVQ
ncbi:hypothetical protein M3I54_35935 [Paraburkholderia sp. CNPSo 3274]|uniref:hypothetical protein n=1 Tax=unclassified Paraburkholderia TaxID=2615204 RepID=UPI0020B71412|nr:MULTISPECIES: hypothetical protein [unclassified Paraburkholderia]MCP3712274.1 hypothetical protein [Paraburkholderia sp. CNPSo 3274]MCP3718499.1 hypothetical protein [Paraburkholderia sp. CNPSo 3281]MCP3724666.1 hypothetical protein [Paraburkholderia sp. CNPSo 3272]